MGLERRYLGWYLGMSGRNDEAISQLTQSIGELTAVVGDRHHTIALAEATIDANREMAVALRGSDFREGVASFMEKRPPRFTGD